MTTATATRLADPQARVLNVLYNLTHLRADGGSGSFTRFGHAIWRADLPDRETLYGLVRSGLVRMRDSDDARDLDPDEASEERIINSHLSLSAAGTAWVEDNPRNALLRKVDASPLGRVTLVRALEVVGQSDRSVILSVVHDGYVAVHDAETHLEVGRNRFGGIWRAHPERYILLPTSKIRRVLGERS